MEAEDTTRVREKSTVLIVDDVAENVVILGEILESDCDVRFCLSGKEAIRIAAEVDIDLILLDVEMPGMNGYQVCQRLKDDEQTMDIPIIFVTSRDAIEDEARGLAVGAVDYIRKPFSIPIVKARVRTHVELKRRTDLLARLAQFDGLTGIANRRRFDEVLEQEWARATRDKTWLSLLLIDVDHFKGFNDRYGHPAGDECLRKVAARLSGAHGRAGDLVARYGGEEFAVILPTTDSEGAFKVAEVIRTGVADLGITHEASSADTVVTVSIGFASFIPDPADSPASLISSADAGLYAAKEGGRNRACRDSQN